MAKHEKFFVDSSFISHAIFDEDKRHLIIVFASGSIWAYKDVSFEIYNRLICAPSIGAYFNTTIRNKYESVPLAKVGKSFVVIYNQGEQVVEKEEKEKV